MNDSELKILEAAVKLFTRQGVKKTTVDEIAREANIGKGTVYIYFKSKAEVLSAVIRRQAETVYQNTLLKVPEDADLPEALFRLVMQRYNALSEMVAAYGIRNDVYEEIITENRGMFLEILDREAAVIQKILEKGVADGTLHVPDPELICRAIHAVLFSLDSNWLFDETPASVEQKVRMLVQVLFDGLSKRA